MSGVFYPPRVKICGLTNAEDAIKAVEFGADALGFICVPSKRTIEPDLARSIVRQLTPFIATVGVFMDMQVEEVMRITRYAGFDRVQLHGDESPEYCQWIDRPVIKRFKIDADETSESLQKKLDAYDVAGYLLDPGAGDGKTFSWEIAKSLRQSIILAGGLTPENVREAVQTIHPYAVDVSSGVETELRKKDYQKIERFIKEAKCL